MAKGRARKNTKQSASNKNNCDQDGIALDKKVEQYQDHEVERQSAAIRALRDVEIEQLQTMLRLLRSYFSKEQLKVPVLQFFSENLPNLSIAQTGKEGQYEVQWKDKDGNLSLNQADEQTIHASLLHRLSLAYPDYSAGIPSLNGFDFSNKSGSQNFYEMQICYSIFFSFSCLTHFTNFMAVKTSCFGADKLQIRSLVLEEASDSQVFELKDCMQTPDVSNNRLSIGMTPKTLRLPKHGEMLLSVHGSPLGVYKEDNMETIQETEDD